MTITTTDNPSSYHDRISDQLSEMSLLLAVLTEQIDRLRRLGAPLVIDLDRLTKLGQSVQAMHQEMIGPPTPSVPVPVESALPKQGRASRKPRPPISTSSTEDWCIEDLEFSPEDFL
jgi:hypothetical protein